MVSIFRDFKRGINKYICMIKKIKVLTIKGIITSLYYFNKEVMRIVRVRKVKGKEGIFV